MTDPYTLKRPPAEEETRTFAENGQALVVTLRTRSDFTRKLLGVSKYRENVTKYLVGEQVTDRDGATHREVSNLRAVDGMTPAVTEELCDFLATLETLQVPTEALDLLTFEQWAGWGLVMPESMGQIYEWVRSLMAKAGDEEGAAKNGSGAAAAP